MYVWTQSTFDSIVNRQWSTVCGRFGNRSAFIFGSLVPSFIFVCCSSVLADRVCIVVSTRWENSIKGQIPLFPRKEKLCSRIGCPRIGFEQ